MKIILAMAFLAGCTGTNDLARSGKLTTGTGVVLTVAEAAVGIGKVCTADADCLSGLTCTDLLGTPTPECQMQWVDFTSAPCPVGFEPDTSATTNLGTVDLGNLQVTGYWCIPQCDTYADCGNGLCCLSGQGYGGAPHGVCAAFNPGERYPAPISCQP